MRPISKHLPRPLLRASLLIALVAGCAPAALRTAPAPPTMVVVVRHAERASEEDRDSPLSPAGEVRARALADALADARVEAIYATQYRRTRQTARPLAERLGLTIVVDSARGGQAVGASTAALARRILTEQPGRTVLVVGHSNTVPLLVRALGGAEVGPLESGDYDDLFIVLVPAEGPARTLRTRYGT